MLRELEVWNFRQHRYKKFTFTGGLNAIRGANESGKTTIIEAITYALFGISACRESLAQVVTWGEAESSLKVRLTMTIEGTDYVITRKKSGAELNYEGEKVTGQTEVAAKIGRIFGCSTKNVNRLVLAGQGNIRGALAEGSTKTSALIEELANFGVIDEILKLIEMHLVTGPTTAWTEKTVKLSEDLTGLEAALVVPDTVEDDLKLRVLESDMEGYRAESAFIMEKIGPLAERRDALRARAEEKSRLEERVKLLAEQRNDACRALTVAIETTPKDVDTTRLEGLRTAIATAAETDRRLKGRDVLVSLEYPATYWDKSWDDFQVVFKATGKEWEQAQQLATDRVADIRVKESEMIASEQCGFCGQDFSKLPEVVAKNQTIRQDLARLKSERDGAVAACDRLEKLFNKMDGIRVTHLKFQNMLAPYARDIKWDTSVVPHKPTWAFPAMQGLVDVEAARKELAALEDGVKAAQTHAAKVAVLDDAARRAATQEIETKLKLDEGFKDLAELPKLEEECDTLNKGYSFVYSMLVSDQTKHAEILARVTAAKQAYEMAKGRVDAVRAAKDEAEKMVNDLSFNNALKSRVQKARPIIANKLWSKVLAAVSRYFTQMRGEESVVTKDLDGFKVNGKAIEGLSGSTLDILGLAIRLALVRTFLPHTPLLILDEPSAACDEARTSAMMGFLVSCGFDQMLLVTHEDMSERVAENLIAL